MKLIKEKSSKIEFSETFWLIAMAAAITATLFAASLAAAVYMKEWGHVFTDWFRILTSPAPLITDYYSVGGLSSAFLNAGVCGLVCLMPMVLLKGKIRPNAIAGYFLVIAHCFYGLNLVNMLPCFLAPVLYFKVKKLDVKNNIHVCMFATCFGPFISEFLFRYTLGNNFIQGSVNITLKGIIITLLFALMIGFVIPAILPGAHAWHKGYNLFNGGLAFGIFGFFVYNLLYTSFGIKAPKVLYFYNAAYESFSHSYSLFVNVYFLILFVMFFLAGFIMNDYSMHDYRRLLTDTGHMSSFYERYGIAVCFINVGLYGMMFLLYVNLVMTVSEGVGFTGPTTGVIFAAVTFSLLGQHPQNVWPILAGFLGLYAAQIFVRGNLGLDLGWTISTQPYINAAAFATGICPITGRYGKAAGFTAGIIDAALCKVTSAFHGGLVLYNGGFTAGLTVLILLPILEHYVKEINYKNVPVSMQRFIIVEEQKNAKK